MVFRFLLLLVIAGAAEIFGAAHPPRTIKIAILDRSEDSSKFTDQFSEDLEQSNFKLLDKDLARAAATGARLTNPFNLTVDQAKNLTVLIDCNFLLVVKNETLQRSSFQKNVYFESYAIIFLVSAQTGRLLFWTDKQVEANVFAESEKLLLTKTKTIADEFARKIVSAAAQEQTLRATDLTTTVLIEDLPDETGIHKQNFRVPLPFKRFSPAYSEAAGRRDVEATVDVLVELDERGAVTRTEIVRWAGFDLDEAAERAVKKMQFRPALRDGKPLPIRILLRYNFRDLEN